MRVKHFYHVYADGQWQGPAAEHFTALRDAGLKTVPAVGIVGRLCHRRDVGRWLTSEAGTWTLAAEADEGFEQVTLAAMHRWCQRAHPSAVLYAHTKGAFHPSDFNHRWRRSMTSCVIGRWANCCAALTGYDAAGCHWLTAGEYPGQVVTPYFGGNFWWARSSYLARLPPPPLTQRHDAETWIGLGAPTVKDMSPGWPALNVFAAGGQAPG